MHPGAHCPLPPPLLHSPARHSSPAWSLPGLRYPRTFAGKHPHSRRAVPMYVEAVHALGDQAVAKLTEQRRSLTGHLVRSAMAGMYVGAAIVLIFTIGGLMSDRRCSVSL